MDDFVLADAVQNLVEAQLLTAILIERGIPHRIQSFHDTAYDGLFQTGHGWGVVWTTQEHVDAVRVILTDIRVEWTPPTT